MKKYLTMFELEGQLVWSFLLWCISFYFLKVEKSGPWFLSGFLSLLFVTIFLAIVGLIYFLWEDSLDNDGFN